MSYPPPTTGDGPRTGPGDEPGRDPTKDWEAMVDVFVDCSRRVLDRVSERAHTNIGLLRERQYGVEEWLDDVRWFWDGVAEDTTTVVEGFQQLRPER